MTARPYLLRDRPIPDLRSELSSRVVEAGDAGLFLVGVVGIGLVLLGALAGL